MKRPLVHDDFHLSYVAFLGLGLCQSSWLHYQIVLTLRQFSSAGQIPE